MLKEIISTAVDKIKHYMSQLEIIEAIKYYRPLSKLERNIWVEAKFFAEKEGTIGFTTDKKRYEDSNNFLDEDSGKVFVLIEEINSKPVMDISNLIKYIPPERNCVNEYLDIKEKSKELDSIYKIKVENIMDDVKLNTYESE